jgi:hypothetical protein
VQIKQHKRNVIMTVNGKEKNEEAETSGEEQQEI